MKQQRGLTLVELLIAMSLTVLISALAYRFLDTAVQVEAQAEESIAELMALEQFFVLLAADLEHAVDRGLSKPAVGVDPLSALLPEGDASVRPALLSASLSGQPLAMLTAREGALLWFTRRGWINPLQENRSDVQRVLYRLDNNRQLLREYWPERNQPLLSAPESSRVLIEDVQSIEFSYLPRGADPRASTWLREWPLPQPLSSDTAVASLPQRLPAAVRVAVDIGALGRVERTFVMRGV